MYVNEPPADCQKVWHEFVGRYIRNKNILDVGAGGGESKERMEMLGNTVLTQDINRALMDRVDFVGPVSTIIGKKFDVVTAFDVLEHVHNPVSFLQQIWVLAEDGIFFTTPNYFALPRSWHYRADEVLEIVAKAELSNFKKRFFIRKKSSTKDYIFETEKTQFLEDKSAYGFGLHVLRGK